MEPFVIYHANCNDGFTAAWVAHRALGGAELYAAQHGQAPPDVTNRVVYIVDFSYDRATLQQMHDDAKSLVVIDHHKTAEAALQGLDYCIFDMNKSGASLTWDYFHPNTHRPLLVQYVEDRDLWKHKLFKSFEISATLFSYTHDLDTWDCLAEKLETNLDEMILEGETLMREQQLQVELACQRAQEITLCGHNVLAVNSTVLFSEIAGKLAENRPFGVAWFQRDDGDFVYSLRSKDYGEDVSQIAKNFGGGGHRNAAGFQSKLLPWQLS